MKRFTLKELKNLVSIGAAVDITNAPFNLDTYHRLDPIGVSRGIYGMNGGLLKDHESGQLCAILSRNSALFFYF